MPSGVVVLGMHRSGTSAVTRVLNLLGADVGPSQDLLSEYDNPRGHWESKTLVEANDDILAAFGRSWDFPPWIGDGWERDPRVSSMLPELKDKFASVFNSQPWVWKDPRTCLTLPLWRRVLGADIVIVLVLRSARDIVASLSRRDAIPAFYAVGLWHHYLREAVRSSAGLPVVCLRFEELLGSPMASTAKLAEDLESLGMTLGGDVATAASSLHGAQGAGRSPTQAWPLVDRLTRPTDSILGSLPSTSRSLSPPSWREPRWVRPALTLYRAHWVLRARSGHPLRPRFA